MPLGKLGALRKNKFLKIYIFREFLVLKAKCLCNFWPFFFLVTLRTKKWTKNVKKMVLGKLIDHFKNYFLLRYNIYDFLKQISGCLWPTRLVRTHCAVCRDPPPGPTTPQTRAPVTNTIPEWRSPSQRPFLEEEKSADVPRWQPWLMGTPRDTPTHHGNTNQNTHSF